MAKSFYANNGYVEEYYDCQEDSGASVETLSIFSKALYPDGELLAWNNRNMHIDEQLLKEQGIPHAIKFADRDCKI